MDSKAKENFIAYILLIVGVIGFSIKSVFIKLCYSYGVSSNALFILRMGLSLPFYLLVLLFYIRKKKINKNKFPNKQIILLLIFGSLCYYISVLTDMHGLEFVNVAIERTIIFTFPSIVAVLSIIILGSKYNSRLFPSLLICYIGVILSIYSGSGPGPLIHDDILYGMMLLVISAIVYAFFYIISEKALQTMNANIFNTLSMTLTCALTLVINFHFLTQNIFSFDYKVYILSLFMAVFSTVMPSFFIMKSISKLGATTVSVFNNLGPFVTLIFGYLILDEPITILQLLGTVLVVCGIVYLKSENYKKQKPSAEENQI